MKLLENNPRMKICCLPGASVPPIQWHHVWIYAGKQIDEAWAIVAVSEHKHKLIESGDLELRDEARRESLKLATLTDLQKYPKFDWPNEARRLGLIYNPKTERFEEQSK
jgi:hypothetical protein